ncbi:MAG TPA: hypothetical protein VF723_04885 [Pyrinomonadaceae bacterium]
MKLLIFLGLAAVLCLIIYLRLRPYILMARRMFGVARDVGRMTRNEPAGTPNSAGGTGDRLTRCAACGTWTPASRAIKLRSSSSSYCSHACLERAAESDARQRAAGGE